MNKQEQPAEARISTEKADSVTAGVRAVSSHHNHNIVHYCTYKHNYLKASFTNQHQVSL